MIECPGCGHQIGDRLDDGTVMSSVRTKHFGSRTIWGPSSIQCEVCGALWHEKLLAGVAA